MVEKVDVKRTMQGFDFLSLFRPAVRESAGVLM